MGNEMRLTQSRRILSGIKNTVKAIPQVPAPQSQGPVELLGVIFLGTILYSQLLKKGDQVLNYFDMLSEEDQKKPWVNAPPAFDYGGFNPKPKLFAAFQFPNV